MTEMQQGSTPAWRDYLIPYGEIVAERFSAGSTVSMDYFVGDHLGSTTSVTNSTPAVQEYDSYDAWGRRRYASGSDYPPNCLTVRPASVTLRGYTGQEEMDSYCLVNLNARIYDPSIGRFPSADPTIPDAMDGQSYNRYSYVENDPLTFTDPSGFMACDGNGEDRDWLDTGGNCESDAGTGQGDNTSSVGSDGVETVVVWGIRQPFAICDGACGGDETSSDIFTDDSGDINGGGGPTQPVNSPKKTQNPPCTAATRAAAAGAAAMDSVHTAASFGMGIALTYLGGGAFAVGCIDPTPVVVGTCALSTFAAFNIWAGAGTAFAMSAVQFDMEVMPDVSEALCG